MSEQFAWLEPIRTAAAAIAADPPLTEWEAGEGDCDVIDDEVEKLLKEVGWPTRTETSTVHIPVYKSNPRRTEAHQSTQRYFRKRPV